MTEVPTGELNRFLEVTVQRHRPPTLRGKAWKLYYATQVGTQPPTIVLVCNTPRAFSPDYRRYLLGVLRDQLDFGEVPIKLYLNARKRDDTRDEVESEDKSIQPGETPKG